VSGARKREPDATGGSRPAAGRRAGDTAPAEAAATVRVVLPEHLRTLAGIGREIRLPVSPPVTLSAVLDAIEEAHPVLRGAIRDHDTLARRAFVRFFAVGLDLSHQPADTPLPAAVAAGSEPFVVVGAMAGG